MPKAGILTVNVLPAAAGLAAVVLAAAVDVLAVAPAAAGWLPEGMVMVLDAFFGGMPSFLLLANRT